MPTKRANIRDIFQGIDTLMQTAVTQDEMKDVLEAVRDFLRKTQADFQKNIAKNKDEMTAETTRIGEEVAAVEERVRNLISQVDGATKEELDRIRVELKTDIDAVDSKIKYFDDTELRQSLSEVTQRIDNLKIPDEFDATDLVAQIDKNTEEIEELKKRPTGTGSGGTRRVFQPYLDRFQGDGNTKTFYLSREPLRTNNIEVWGTDFPIVLDPENDFTVVGKTLTLTAEVDTPTNGAIIVIKYYA